MNTRKPNSGANVGGNDLFGRGAGKGARQAGRGAANLGKLGKKGTRGLARHHHPVKGAEKNAGRAGQAAGLAGQGAGKGLNAAGKGTQAAGKALDSIPYVGPALGGAVGGLGKGMSVGGKGLDKGSKQLRNFSKKLKERGKRGRLAKLAAWSSVHLFGLVGCFMVLLMLLGALLGAEMFMEDDEGSSGCSSGPSVELSGKNNAAKVFNFLVKSEHFSDAGAAGAVGRGMTESGLNPKADNPSGQVGGLFQWGYGGSNGSRLFRGGFVKSSKSTWTLPNEMKLVNYELHHSYSSVSSKMRHMSNPEDAAKYWTDTYEGAPGQAESQAASNARQVYSKLAGHSGASDASDTASSASSSCGSSTDTNSIVKFAKSQLGKHPYSQGQRNEIFTENGKDGSHADCSSFGNYVYYKTGHVHKPSGNAWTTSADIYGLKKISASETKAGDSVVVTSGRLAHWMILLSKWHGPSTMIIDEGGCTVPSCIKAGKPNNVNISSYKDADSDNDHVFYAPEH